MNKFIKIKTSELHPFENNPFTVKLNENFKELTNSIKEYGILTPITVRKRDDGGYEVISGHRRLKAAQLAGLSEIPSIVEELDRDTAVINLVDSNLQRENILPSERAFAYKMKLESIKHQGKTSTQLAEKLSVDAVGASDNISGDTVWRYVRLTELIPEILQYVDDKKIAFSPAVALSYLTENQQYKLLDSMDLNDCTPSYAQSIRLKNLSKENTLTDDLIEEIICEEKPNQVEQFKFPKTEIRKYFPKNYTDKQIYDNVFKALELLKRRRNRDAR